MNLRFYFDEDSMSRSLVEALRQRNVDVATAYEMGMVPTIDEQHLAFATSENRVLYSANVKDFFALHTRWLTQGRAHAGIVVAKQQQFSIGGQRNRLLNLMHSLQAAEMQDRLEFLQNW